MSSNHAFCPTSSWSALSVGSSSSEDDDLLDSFRGLSSLGIFGHRFCWMDQIFSLRSDSGSVSSCHINVRFWAVGNGEGYFCLEQNVYGKLWEQVEHLQCNAQAGIKHDDLILCQGVDSGPHLISHVA